MFAADSSLPASSLPAFASVATLDDCDNTSLLSTEDSSLPATSLPVFDFGDDCDNKSLFSAADFSLPASSEPAFDFDATVEDCDNTSLFSAADFMTPAIGVTVAKSAGSGLVVFFFFLLGHKVSSVAGDCRSLGGPRDGEPVPIFCAAFAGDCLSLRGPRDGEPVPIFCAAFCC